MWERARAIDRRFQARIKENYYIIFMVVLAGRKKGLSKLPGKCGKGLSRPNQTTLWYRAEQ
jgi:hypothetical protein